MNLLSQMKKFSTAKCPFILCQREVIEIAEVFF